MKSTGILMSAPMIKAYMKGLKTETRRLRGLEEINQHPDTWEYKGQEGIYHIFEHPLRSLPELILGDRLRIKCPYGDVGDELIFREAWAVSSNYDNIPPSVLPTGIEIHYLADGAKPLWCGRTRSALHLPNDFARFKLKLMARPVPQRLHDISLADIQAEGIYDDRATHNAPLQIKKFQELWDSLNAARGYPWSLNHWCWPLKFERHEEGKECSAQK